MDLSVTSVLLLLILILVGRYLLSWVFDKTPKNLPPGPKGWRMAIKYFKAAWNATLHELAFEWSKEYGDIYYINVFGTKFVYLNSTAAIRQICNGEDTKVKTATRYVTAAPRLAWYNGKDLAFAPYDELFKKKRKLFFQLSGLYGNGVQKFETVVLGEMDRLFKELDQHEGEDVDLPRILSKSIKIILYILVMGEQPPDPNTPDILEEFDLAFNKVWETRYDYFLTNFPFLVKFSNEIQTALKKLQKTREAAEHLVYATPKMTHVHGKPRGFADLLFDQAKKPGYEFLDEDPVQIKAFLLNVFNGAHLTSRSLVLALFLSLLNYPKVAKNIQQEIDNVLGERPPKVEDRANMPYTEATILEVLRVASQAPFTGLRLVSNDIIADGMTIPKDSVIMMNLWYLHHDENKWDDPWTLKPERFLSCTGQILPADDPVRKLILPFGSGLRSCPGEVFGRSRAFMFVTSILQKYDLLPPANEELVPADFRRNDESVRGFIRQTLPFKCRLQKRQKKVST